MLLAHNAGCVILSEAKDVPFGNKLLHKPRQWRGHFVPSE